jgi:hypothetical protein
MNIIFTFDYELFFGKNSGTLDNCIIKPTNELIKIADKYNVKFVFFVDSGYIIKLDEYRKKYPFLNIDYQKITAQIKQLSNQGHDIQLHIHSHWEDSFFDGEKWIMDTTRYRLHQFNEQEIDDIVFRYKKVLTEIVGDTVFAFRAGGWCIQPFDKISKALQKHNIWLDSTLYKNGLNLSSTHYIDFRNMPEKTKWKFNDNPLVEDENGFFTEMPISSMRMSPFFYWKFAFTKKFATHEHKIFGDGSPVGASKKDIFKMLTKSSNSVVSCDGYKSSFLEKAYHKYKDDEHGNFIVIGHPKAMSLYSLENMNKFLSDKSKTVQAFRKK